MTAVGRRTSYRRRLKVRVAVTGATGYVGRFIVDALLRAGHKVQAWARPTSERGGFAGEVLWVEGGLGRHGSEQALLRNADALVHAAFEHVLGRYRGGEGNDPERFLAVNREGSLSLLASADAAGIERVVFFSSRAVYGGRCWDRPLDEDHPPRPDTLYGAYKLAVEQGLALGARGRAWSSLRATGVYGRAWPLSRSKWYDVVRTSLGGEAPSARGGTEIAGCDVAAAVQLLLNAPAAEISGRAFNVSDVYVTHRAISRLAGGALAPRSGPPTGIMVTGRLQSLGWRPLGWAGVVDAVESLVAELG